MRYIQEENKIEISTREFVTSARRGISSTLPYDEDEPLFDTVGERVIKKLIPDAKKEKLNYTFPLDEHSFNIYAEACKIPFEDGLFFAACGDIDPKDPKKGFAAQFRGEGYISAYIYCIITGIKGIKLTFVYINRKNGEYFEVSEQVTFKKLSSFFEKCKESVLRCIAPEIDRITKRLPSMSRLKFPYKNIRDGQSEFIRRAYKNIARGGTLYATAPTGTGKTVSALYPAIRAMGDGRRDKTFYFTPKETTAYAAKECIELMRACGAIIRAVIINAKEKQCKRRSLCRDGKELCPASKVNNISEAVMYLYNQDITVVTGAEIATVAVKFSVCPYELSLSYSELCDVIICDYNYLLDRNVYIKRFFNTGGNYTFLFDEAHNLPDRAREIYSASICTLDLLSPQENSPLGEFSATRAASSDVFREYCDALLPYLQENMRVGDDGVKTSSAHISDIPPKMFEIFEYFYDTAEKELRSEFKTRDNEKKARIKFLRDLIYKLKNFIDTMYSFDSSYEMFIFYNNEKINTKLFCIDPYKEISKRLKKGEAAVFFSATLTPLYYYKSVLGSDTAADVLEVNSPFDESQLSVSIMDRISTRYQERNETLSAIIRVITAAISSKRGNYIVFSPSFDYSFSLAKAFKDKYPNLRVLVQKRNMSPKEKEDFLSEFTKDDRSYLIAFCVMGGIYSEGIDLAGESLIGAVIVGIGLPGLSYEREAISAYYDDKYEEGKQFAYIYPGMNRVLQAAGRVIRREDDKGAIILIDDRFADPIYKKIIPKLWSGMKFVSDAKDLKKDLDDFWKKK